MHLSIKKIVQQALAIIILGVLVWYMPVHVLKPTNVEWASFKIEKKLPDILAAKPSIQITDDNGNPFVMRNLNSNEYPFMVNEMKQVAKIWVCRQYNYAGAQWYEWCTEEAGYWVLYRWQKGHTTSRKII